MLATVPEQISAWAGALLAVSAAFKRTWPGRFLRWLWHRNITQPADERFARRVGSTVAPLIDGVKAAARIQHDEQNERLDAIRDAVGEHATRLTDIELALTTPTRRTTRKETAA